MGRWVRACSLGELPPGGRKTVDCGLGELIVLFNVDGTVFALSDTCPHQGAPLSEGQICEGTVYCPMHAWPFSLECTDKPPNDLIRHYCVRIRAGAIYLAAPETD